MKRWQIGLGILVAIVLVTGFFLRNKPSPVLMTATVKGVYWAKSKPAPEGLPDLPLGPDEDLAIIVDAKGVEGGRKPFQKFAGRASRDFVLLSPGHPNVHIVMDQVSHDEESIHFQAFGAQIDPQDRDKVVPGAVYTMESQNDEAMPVHWRINPDVTVVVPKT